MGDFQSNPTVFSVRIVSLDYYMKSPIPGLDVSYSNFHGGRVNEVPVIRIFGSTPAGQKTCLHIHRVFPYLYVPCSDLGLLTNDEVDSRMRALSLGLEKVLKLKGNAGSKRQHVHACCLVRAKKFYGYHASEEPFVKIYLLVKFRVQDALFDPDTLVIVVTKGGEKSWQLKQLCFRYQYINYYPQDVSRAANLLLAGAVFDKALQPYESHIPYILQFLIDYNLYGMGHLHLSKMTFRYPVPDAFAPRKFKHTVRKRSLGDDSACTDPDVQADVVGDSHLNLPIWISSTIPDGWIWRHSHRPDSSPRKDIQFFGRQSSCELEGDALVDEIINQQLISHIPLSQSHSEVKMVQSLVPIWEEEAERNGVPEAIPLDPGKPLPQDVLKILSDGVGLRKNMEVINDAESSLTPEFIQSSKGSGVVNVENSNHLLSKHLETSEISRSLSSLNSSFQNVDAAERHEIDAINENHLAGIVVASSAKASDEDALRLLKWLASSQAAEDMNSDDELTRETILSPLLPAKNIDKVLEKANVDYESESQQECRDILDSVNMLSFDEMDVGSSNPEKYTNHAFTALSNNIIPQVDGSNDDLQATPPADKPTKADSSEAIQSLAGCSLSELESSTIFGHRRKRPRWGSLPMCSQKVDDVSYPKFSISDESDSEKHGGPGTSMVENVAERFPCFVKVEDVSTEKCNTTVESSTRDLMRRNRSHRIELSKCKRLVEYWRAESCSDTGCRKEDMHADTKLKNDFGDKKNDGTKFHDTAINSTREVCSESNHVKAISSCCYARKYHLSSMKDSKMAGSASKSANEEFMVQVNQDSSCINEILHGCKNHDSSLDFSSCTIEHAYPLGSTITEEDVGCRDLLPKNIVVSSTGPSNSVSGDIISNNDCSEIGCRRSNYTCKVTDIPTEDLKRMQIATTFLHVENSESHERYPVFSKPVDLTSENVKDGEPVNLFGMTFSMNPPTLEWIYKPGSGDPLSPVNADGDGDGEMLRLQCRSVDDCIPFFMRNCLGEREHQNVGPRQYEFNDNQEALVGVPMVCQNDGSYLFVLTLAISPPTRDRVDKWLSLYKTDPLRQNHGAESPLHTMSMVFSGETVDSQGSQADVTNSNLLECALWSNEKANSHQSYHHEPEGCSMEAKTNHETEKKPSTGLSQDVSQISAPDRKRRLTPLSQIGFRDPASVGGGQQLTVVSIEVQAESRGDLRPDPRFDAINAIVIVFQEDDESQDAYVLLRSISASTRKDLDAVPECEVLVFTDELDLLNHFSKVIQTYDPDILMGWDVQSGSFGFLAERAAQLGLGFLNDISRIPSKPNAVSGASEGIVKEMSPESVAAEAVLLNDAIIEDEWGRTHASGVHVVGRIVLNIWRLMRNEVKLNMYTVEAVAEALLRRKVPSIPCKVLARWFTSGPGWARHRSINYILERTKLNLQIMNQLDMINRTSELARVFGIDFFSVLSRGSQYRVESMFLRLAHTQNYLAISPGSQQVANQPAMECLPLVMEPESGFYEDPVIVLDFQSLYPSMVIAYNLCFCTCLGKAKPQKEDTLGVSSYSSDINIFCNLKDELLVTPNNVAYVPSNVRKGILPRLLEEILSTRIMMKQAMKKLAPSELVLHRIFNARQLALKLIANVTYGYTAAGFSGRMPCAELADSIVQCGRRTLETAISFVNTNDKWKARVVYGDTDSMFVLLKGRSLKEAFAVGQEIASAITEINPNPVTLKMEKVYYPCFLLTKKRYVGYSYESPGPSKPAFDAKGIETVRRDTCPAVSKTMEQSLRIYFEHQDIDKIKYSEARQIMMDALKYGRNEIRHADESRGYSTLPHKLEYTYHVLVIDVKVYIQRQWTRILSGRISLQDFVFAKEVRLGSYSARASSLPPAAIVATKAMRVDPRAEPRYAERIPYVVVHGEPGARLVDMVVDPLELLAINSPFRLNDIYYIRKQIIPALQRVFRLVGADLNQWFLGMPRPGLESVGKRRSLIPNIQRTRIDYYYLSKHCVLCGDLVQPSATLCHNCSRNESAVVTALIGRSSKLEKDIQHLAAICRHCGGGDWYIESGVKCTSLACSVFYERRKVQKELLSLSEVSTRNDLYPKCMVEWF